MWKKTGLVWLIFLVLFGILFFFLKLTQDDRANQEALLNEAKFQVVLGEQQILVDWYILSQMEQVAFEAVLDTASSDPSLHQYVGVELKQVFAHFGMDISAYDRVVLSGADGYGVVYSVLEVLEDKKVFLAYQSDGAYLGGREKGGRGPYEAIVIGDLFSNRRCKWLTQIEVE